jgi:hypothetical protein
MSGELEQLVSARSSPKNLNYWILDMRYQIRPLFKTVLTAVIGLTVSASCVSADESYDLSIQLPKTSQIQVSANISHSGEVVLLEEDEKKEAKLRFLKLDVAGKLNYFQRELGTNQAIRSYDKAEAKIKIEKAETTSKLSAKNDTVIARLKPGAGTNVEIASIKSTLLQSELELIDSPADPLTHAGLLNKKQIKTGDEWTPKSDALAKFLNVRQVTKSDVELHAKKVDADSARLYLKGSLTAEVGDVETEMKVSGIVIVDMKKRLVSTLKMSIEEKRGQGQIAPGFDGQTIIDIRISDNNSTPKLANSQLTQLTQGRKIRQRLLWSSRAGFFEMAYDPRWKMITSDQEAAVLRFLENGTLMAQCNVVLLPKRPADKPITLDGYKQQVRKIVESDKNAKLISATQKTTDNGNTAICVAVSGIEDGVAVQWNYYHVAATDGRQLTFVYTLEKSHQERIKVHAERMVNEFKFVKIPVVATKPASNQRQPIRK